MNYTDCKVEECLYYQSIYSKLCDAEYALEKIMQDIVATNNANLIDKITETMIECYPYMHQSVLRKK